MPCVLSRTVPILPLPGLNFELADDAISQLIFIVDDTRQIVMYVPISICIEPMSFFLPPHFGNTLGRGGGLRVTRGQSR